MNHSSRIAIVLISVISMLISPAATSLPNRNANNNASSAQQSADVHVEIVKSPSIEDRNWSIIKSETYKHRDPSTGAEVIEALVIRQGPPGKCSDKAYQTIQIDAVTVTCTYRTSETRSSSVLAGGVTGYAKNYADNYCGGSDCTYYKLTKLEIWWTRIGTGWIVRNANTAWGCNGTCGVCPNNTSYTYLYQSGVFTPNFSGGLTSVTYRYTSTSWPIMKSTMGIVWGGNNSVVESPSHVTQSLSVSANF